MSNQTEQSNEMQAWNTLDNILSRVTLIIGPQGAPLGLTRGDQQAIANALNLLRPADPPPSNVVPMPSGPVKRAPSPDIPAHFQDHDAEDL